MGHWPSNRASRLDVGDFFWVFLDREEKRKKKKKRVSHLALKGCFRRSNSDACDFCSLRWPGYRKSHAILSFKSSLAIQFSQDFLKLINNSSRFKERKSWQCLDIIYRILVLVSVVKFYRTLKTMFGNISEQLDVRQKIPRYASYFQLSLCLEMWSNTQGFH